MAKKLTKHKKSNPSLRNELFGSHTRGIDKLLVFRFFKLLHGRFWGIGFIMAGVIASGIGYLIRPDLLTVNTPLSQLGSDYRTAPYFAGAMFFAAYSLWRWRLYLSRTLKNPKPIISLVGLTVFGFYLIALFPVSWEVWPHRIHNIGVVIIGTTMAITVLADSVLSKTKRDKHINLWRSFKLLTFVLIVSGGFITYFSLDAVSKMHLILVGELLMYVGYTFWIILKIYLGEGKKSAVARIITRLLN